MASRLKVPHLKDKLADLFARNGAVATQQQLAGFLRLDPSNLPQWSKDQAVPARHVRRIADLYQVQPEWLADADLDAWRQTLRAHPYARSAWRDLALAAEPSNAIALKRPDPPPDPRLDRRGALYADEDAPEIPGFVLGDRFRVEIALDRVGGAWATAAPAYVFLILTDPRETVCLCPSKSRFAADYKTSGRLFVTPRQTAAEERGRYLTIAPPKGDCTLYALLAREPLDAETYRKLVEGPCLPVLDRLAAAMHATDPRSWRLLKSEFVVLGPGEG